MWSLCITVWLAAPADAAPPVDGGPPETVRPLEGRTAEEDADGLDVGGAAPLQPLAGQGAAREPPPTIAAPFGIHEVPRPVPLDPKRTTIARLDFMVGPLWRARPLDLFTMTSLEVGRMHGFSGTFHTGFIIGMSDRLSVRALDVPIGVGGLFRGRLRRRPGFAGIGLTAGLLAHRAVIDGRVVRRVDPDFRLPIRFAWTFSTAGISLAVEQGYSVRTRSYERRGAELWARHAYRIGLMVGLHLDLVVRPARRRSPRGSVDDAQDDAVDMDGGGRNRSGARRRL